MRPINESVAHVLESNGMVKNDRPSTNSEGKPIAKDEAGLKAFWSWFGKSEIVDKQGRPLVLYHGTTADFDEFEEGSHFGTKAAANDRLNDLQNYQGMDPEEEGMHFSIMPVYLNFQNALVLEGDLGNRDDWEDLAYAMGQFDEAGDNEQVVEFLEDKGQKSSAAAIKHGRAYDGVIYPNAFEGNRGQLSYMALGPYSIKSALSSKFGFSPKIQEQLLTELYDPEYPKGTKHSIHKKAGVQGSTVKRNQYRFTTPQGNDVKVLFKIGPVDTDEADVIFYVNDTLDDGASGGLDPAILAGVLGIVKKVADRRKLNTITFEAWSGQGDNKIVRGLREQPEVFAKSAAPVLKWTEENEPEMLPPTERQIELAEKFGREAKPRPSWPKEQLEKALGHLMAYSNDGSPVFASAVNDLERSFGQMDGVIPGWGDMMHHARKLADARMSNTEHGLRVTRNRREAVYDRLMKRHMPEWNVEKSYGFYTLTRKEPV